MFVAIINKSTFKRVAVNAANLSLSPITIKEVTNLEALKKEVVSSVSSHGSGGMKSKIEAASLSRGADIETWIVNGLEDDFITNAFESSADFTKIK